MQSHIKGDPRLVPLSLSKPIDVNELKRIQLFVCIPNLLSLQQGKKKPMGCAPSVYTFTHNESQAVSILRRGTRSMKAHAFVCWLVGWLVYYIYGQPFSLGFNTDCTE